MDTGEQVRLVRQFMLRLGPVITRHALWTVEKTIEREYYMASKGVTDIPDDNHLQYLRDEAALQAAQMTLRWAMHLAAQFAQCQDTINETQPIKEENAATSIQREATGSAG